MRFLMFAAATFVFAPAVAHATQTYEVDKWPGDLDTIPCDAWEHNADGSWSLQGYVKIGGSVVEDVGFNKGDASARLLDKKCGKK